MTPWHEYLMDVYVTCKILIAITCIPIGLLISFVSLDLEDLKRAIWGAILVFLGVIIPVLSPTPQVLIKLLEW